MDRATVTQAKNGLSALLDRVRSGETIVITDRGVPVAMLEPVTAAVDPVGRLARLERAGIVRPPRDAKAQARLSGPPPSFGPGSTVLDALLEERRSGR